MTRGTSLINNSDNYHPPLEISLQSTVCRNKITQTLKNEHKNYSTRLNYAKGDFLKLYCTVQSIDWTPLYSMCNTNQAANFLQEKMYSAVCDAVPQSRQRAESCYPPWFTCHIIRLIKLKEKARKAYKRNSSEINLLHYKTLRKHSKKMIKETYKLNNDKIENDIHEKPETFWKFINSERANTSHPCVFTYGNEKLTEPQQIAEAFAKHFKSVFNKPTSTNSLSTCVNNNYQSISLGNITNKDVERALKHLKSKRAVGPDGIPEYIYKGCSEFLISPLRYIFDLAVRTNTFPQIWTISSVTPIPKTANTSNIPDSRPITNMPVPNKIFKK